MPLIEPRPWRCPECGWYGKIYSSPVHCVCGALVEVSTAKVLFRWGEIATRLTTKAGITTSCGGCGRRAQDMDRAGQAVTKALKLDGRG